MQEMPKVHQLYGDTNVFARCRADRKFAYVVALARAANALYSAHSLMKSADGKTNPGAIRDKWNSYFFVSAILYEILKLIRTMNAVFGKEEIFQNTIQKLLKDKIAQEVERMHLKSARHETVFHFRSESFAEAIGKTPMTDCVFASFLGENRTDIRYEFADIIAAEIGVGGRIDNEPVVNDMMTKTLHVSKTFIAQSEKFILDQLCGWGFMGIPGPSVSQGNQ